MAKKPYTIRRVFTLKSIRQFLGFHGFEILKPKIVPFHLNKERWAGVFFRMGRALENVLIKLNKNLGSRALIFCSLNDEKDPGSH